MSQQLTDEELEIIQKTMEQGSEIPPVSRGRLIRNLLLFALFFTLFVLLAYYVLYLGGRLWPESL